MYNQIHRKPTLLTQANCTMFSINVVHICYSVMLETYFTNNLN